MKGIQTAVEVHHGAQAAEPLPEYGLVEAGVRDRPGPWRTVEDYIIQGYALWEVQGKPRDKPWLPAKRRRGVQQCTGCGAIFGGVAGFTRHRAGMRCNDPADIGLRRADDGVWRSPTPIFRKGDGVFQEILGRAMDTVEADEDSLVSEACA